MTGPAGTATGRWASVSNGAIAGRRVHILSVLTVTVLALFLLAVIALVLADLLYVEPRAIGRVLGHDYLRRAIRLSAITSGATLLLVLFFAIPIGYALSRYRFPGHAIANTIVDFPIVLPPLVIGISLLVFFRTPIGRWINNSVLEVVYSVPGIVLCQFLVSASYGIRSVKAAFDGVDEQYEHLAMTLGCTHLGAFWRVALPLARNGIIAGSIMAWARAVGVFGPIMVFAGNVRNKTEVMPTAIYLEISIGNVQDALAIALLMLAIAMAALGLVHWLAPGRKRWGG